ncbi:hypothetical protein WAE56_20405 [Iodobacter sp. LRB]|uniref:hypothetical protein n=1 Tax=Iodobacter sp. LRB TaxID=3127955 RepID=UPI00307F59C1
MRDRPKDVITKLYHPPIKARQALTLSRAIAEMIPELLVAMISITASELTPANLPSYEHLLRLSFADADFISKSLPTRAQEKLPDSMTEDQAVQILKLVESLPNEKMETIVSINQITETILSI